MEVLAFAELREEVPPSIEGDREPLFSRFIISEKKFLDFCQILIL
jgi:hypothetical protein